MEKTTKWVTIREATQLLRRSERTIWRYVASERLPIDKTQMPFVVDVSGELADAEPTSTDTATLESDTLTERLTRLTAEVDRLTPEVERLTVDNVRLQTLVDELKGERDYLRQVHMASLMNTQQLTERAGERPRRFRWPWQRET